jgi:peptidoglycan/xylan/chitin deacetylase (PgdA/CDA1 family)
MSRTFAFAVSFLFLLSAPGLVAREVALTFDDAPLGDGPVFTGAERATELIRKLHAADVEGAIFFATAVHMERQGAERLVQYQQSGHYIANHSYSHRDPEDLGLEAYIADIERAHEALSGFENFLPLYRFPFLREGRDEAMRDGIREALEQMDYRHGYVTVDSFDWYMANLLQRAVEAGQAVDYEKLGKLYVDILVDGVEFYDAIAVRTLGRSPKHSLLLHENDLAALYIDDLVAALRDRGWSIIDGEEAYRDEIAQILPDTLFLGQGRVAAIAESRGESRSGLVHYSEDVEWMDKTFSGSGVFYDEEAGTAAKTDVGSP